MCSKMTAVRFDPRMVEQLKQLALVESVRRGHLVTWATLLREGAARTLRKAKKRERMERAVALPA